MSSSPSTTKETTSTETSNTKGNDLTLKIPLVSAVSNEFPNSKMVGDKIKTKLLTPNICPAGESATRIQVQNYLHSISGQLKKQSIVEIEHSYALPCNVHPDPQIKAHETKYLFMKHFPKYPIKESIRDTDEIDVVSYEEVKKIPLLTSKPQPQPIKVDDETVIDLDSISKEQWSCEQTKLMTRVMKIFYSDRVARLTSEGNSNEVLLKGNLQLHTSNKLRELLASTSWDMQLIQWLHQTLMDYLNPSYKSVYVECLQILRQKIPKLIEKFYSPKIVDKDKASKPTLNDPAFNTLNHYKPKKLPRKTIFILVPNGPTNPNQPPTHRQKYWRSLLSSMGKLVILTVPGKPTDSISDLLSDIRCTVNDKIRALKNSFNNRPIVLVGFNSGSIIAAFCALQNPKEICSVICLGFPLKSISGCRGEISDPLFNLLCPIQFIIGEYSMMTSIDDIEDFRERFLFTETSLVVVGAADDKLRVSSTKKRLEYITQSMVDRCIVDEIFTFLSPILIRYSDDIGLPFTIGMLNDPKFLMGKFYLQNENVFSYFNYGLSATQSFHFPLSQPKKKSQKRKKSDTMGMLVGQSPTNPIQNVAYPSLYSPDDKAEFKRKRPRSRSKRKSETNESTDQQFQGSNSYIASTSGQSTTNSNFSPVIPTGSENKQTFNKVLSLGGIPFSKFTKKVVRKSISTPTEGNKSMSITDLGKPIQNETKSTTETSTVNTSVGSTQTNLTSTLSNSTAGPVNVSCLLVTSTASQISPTNTGNLPAQTSITKSLTTTSPSITTSITSITNSSPLVVGSTRTGRQIKPPKTLVDF